MIDSKLNSEHQTLLKAMELHSLRETKVDLRFKKKKKEKNSTMETVIFPKPSF